MASVNWDAAHKDRQAGMKYEEIAEKYGVTVSAVKSRAARYWKKADTEKSATKGKKVAEKVAEKVATKKPKVAKKSQKKVATPEAEKTDKIGRGKNSRAEKSGGENTDSKTNTKKPGGQPNNQNAAGNRGGIGGPKENKFALTTGEFESIFFTPDIIEEDERPLLKATFDKYVAQLVLIKTEQTRVKRIMQRIAALKSTPGGMVFESATKNKSTVTTQYRKRTEEGELVDGSSNTVTEEGSAHVAVPVFAEIVKLEDALTRVQGRLQRAIEVWHRMELDDEKRVIDRAKFKLYTQRLAGYVDLDELLGDEELWELLDEDGEV